MIKCGAGTVMCVNLSSLCFWKSEILMDWKTTGSLFSTLVHLTQVTKTHNVLFQTSYWNQDKIDADSLHYNEPWKNDLWSVCRLSETHKICSMKCLCVCVCLCVNFLSGGAGNSIGLGLKEFRPPKQGHVLMFSRSFLRSQTVTFNYHSHYPTSLSSSV